MYKIYAKLESRIKSQEARGRKTAQLSNLRDIK
jgi:hypothetical protein